MIDRECAEIGAGRLCLLRSIRVVESDLVGQENTGSLFGRSGVCSKAEYDETRHPLPRVVTNASRRQTHLMVPANHRFTGVETGFADRLSVRS
jgi:hypothetical protein